MAPRRRAPSVSMTAVAPQLAANLSAFQSVARPGTFTTTSQVVPQTLVVAITKTKTTKRAVQFACPKQWQKRVCDSLYATIRKTDPTYTVHRVCTRDQVVMWVTPYEANI